MERATQRTSLFRIRFGPGRYLRRIRPRIALQRPDSFHVLVIVLAAAGLAWALVVAGIGDFVKTSVSPQAEFAPPYKDAGLDADQDGQFDFLAVDVGLRVAWEGEYFLLGRLHGSDGTPIVTASDSPRLSAGHQTVRLLFDGRAINASGIDGPYTADLRLERMDEPIDSVEHSTAQYSHASFESPFAHFAPQHSDEGVDADGDGRFESLAIDATVTVETAGRYAFRAWAHDGNGTLRLIVDEGFDLALGTQTVRFTFDGATINASGVDGPYTVDLWLFAPDLRHSDFDTFKTAPYRASDFSGLHVERRPLS